MDLILFKVSILFRCDSPKVNEDTISLPPPLLFTIYLLEFLETLLFFELFFIDDSKDVIVY